MQCRRRYDATEVDACCNCEQHRCGVTENGLQFLWACTGCNGDGFHLVTCKTAVREPVNGLYAHVVDDTPQPETTITTFPTLCDCDGPCEDESNCRLEYAPSDPVNHPAHYCNGTIECIDAIQAALTAEEFKGYCKGQVFKYTWRAGLKGNTLEDTRKAEWYLKRLITTLENE